MKKRVSAVDFYDRVSEHFGYEILGKSRKEIEDLSLDMRMGGLDDAALVAKVVAGRPVESNFSRSVEVDVEESQLALAELAMLFDRFYDELDYLSTSLERVGMRFAAMEGSLKARRAMVDWLARIMYDIKSMDTSDEDDRERLSSFYRSIGKNVKRPR